MHGIAERAIFSLMIDQILQQFRQNTVRLLAVGWIGGGIAAVFLAHLENNILGLVGAADGEGKFSLASLALAGFQRVGKLGYGSHGTK